MSADGASLWPWEYHALFSHLDAELGTPAAVGCGHTLQLTREWLADHVPAAHVEEWLAWLAAHGGGCDCTIATAAAESVARMDAETLAGPFGDFCRSIAPTMACALLMGNGEESEG